jgi:GTPase SAR1 family protein
MEHDRYFRFVVIGPEGSGKTSLINAYAPGGFIDKNGVLDFVLVRRRFVPGETICKKKLTLYLCLKKQGFPRDLNLLLCETYEKMSFRAPVEDDSQGGLKVKMQIWDTVGGTKLKGQSWSIRRVRYRVGVAVVICVDLADAKSLEQLPEFMQDIEMYAHDDCLRIIVGCKKDLRPLKQQRNALIEKFLEDERFCYCETSAKLGIGVEEAFRLVIRKSDEAFLKREERRQEANNPQPKKKSNCVIN